MIDAGLGHYLVPLLHNCKRGQGVPMGYFWWHLAPDNSVCCGVVRTCTDHKATAEPDAEYWGERLEDGGPSLTPSLLCKKCDVHGFITKGKWVNAGGPVPNLALLRRGRAPQEVGI